MWTMGYLGYSSWKKITILLLPLVFSSFYFPYEAGREIVPSLNPHRSLGSMKRMEEDTAKEYCKILYYSP
jgi:hypothetical protein